MYHFANIKSQAYNTHKVSFNKTFLRDVHSLWSHNSLSKTKILVMEPAF